MMRWCCLLAVLSLTFLSVACQSGGGNKYTAGPEANAPIDSPTATLTVYGMGCPLCAQNLDKQLLAIKGVEKVDVDMGSGNVHATFAANQKPTRGQLARAVEESGFTLVNIQTP